MDQNPNNDKGKDNLKESCEHFDASNGKDMKNIEEKMQKLEIEGVEHPKMEGQMESEEGNEADEEDFFVPNWLIEVLEWIKRIEMADSALSTSCWGFNEHCGPKLHGKNVKQHMVEPIELNAECDIQSGNMRAIAFACYDDQSLPIPSTPLPDYILGFKLINIYFLDDRVLEFIKCILLKLDGIKFVVDMLFEAWNEEEKRSQAIQCLLNSLADRIGYFRFMWRSDFKNFNQHFPQFINKCQFISIYNEEPNFEKPEFDVLFEWLTNRQEIDAGKQKVLEFPSFTEFQYFLGRIKEEFSDSTKPLNFLIIMDAALAEYDVDLENENTGEVLISYGDRGELILRCPKGQEEQWKKAGEEKMSMCDSNEVTSIRLAIKHFGTFTDLAKNEHQ